MDEESARVFLPPRERYFERLRPFQRPTQHQIVIFSTAYQLLLGIAFVLLAGLLRTL